MTGTLVTGTGLPAIHLWMFNHRETHLLGQGKLITANSSNYGTQIKLGIKDILH